MEEDATSRRSVAELAGRFKDSAPPHDAAEHETKKPVRRRPPRSLQLPKAQDQEEPPGVTSPFPAKAKRNSALIEKLQANLALSPSALLPSPKSPGFRLLPPFFAPPSPSSAPGPTVTTHSPGTAGAAFATPPSTSPLATSPLPEEEGPVSFEAPPTVAEGSILSNSSIKGRARHSIRRRPPSRLHRQSSSGDEVSIASEGGAMSLCSPADPEDNGVAGEGKVFKQDGETDEVRDKRGSSTCPENKEPRQRDRPEIGGDEGEEGGKESTRGREGVEYSSGRKEEEEAEEKNAEKEDMTEVATSTGSKGEGKTRVDSYVDCVT